MEVALPSLRFVTPSAVAGLLFSTSLIVGTQTAASAGCTTVEQVNYDQGAVHVSTIEVCTDAEVTADSMANIYAQAMETAHLAACLTMATELGLAPLVFCLLPDLENPPGVTPNVVMAALRRIPLPPSELIVQPPNGRTLVNFDTNFYTQTPPLTRTLRLFGQRVQLRIWPSTYTWHFGDGETQATTSAGAPYPDLEITHNYTTKGHVSPSVDTTYQAQFRVNNSPWRPVPGTVTIPGDTVTLDVVEATPTLVGYR